MREKRPRAVPFVALLLALPSAVLARGSIELVRRGQAKGAIVLAAEPSQGESFAAQELQRYVEKATGARLAIEREPCQRPGVYIGATRLAASLGLPKGELKTDGFNAVATDGKLAIVGRNDLATRYGVYTLLHEALGVRWFMPTELFEHVPKRGDVSARPSRWRTVPAFDPRTFYAVWSKGFSYVGERDPQAGCDVWGARNRLSVDRRGWPGDFSHNLYRVVVPSRYAKPHPEYFPLREDGTRHIPRDDRDQSWQPCFSQDGVVQLCVEAARKAFDADPKRRCFSLGINDGWGCCCCPACAKLDAPKRKSRGRVVHSGSYFTFVNRVAREVATTHPDRLLGCIAYNETEVPPPFAIEPTVWVWHTQDTSQHHDRRYRDGDRDLLRGWLKATRNLCKYDYYGLTWVVPRYFPREIAADLRWCEREGVRGYFVEDCPVWATMGPLLYIAARLHWDPEQDWRDLQREFCRGLFGSSARAMERLFDTWEAAWRTRREGQWFEGLGRVRQQVPLFPPKVVARCDGLLEDAKVRADSDLVRQRVSFFQRGWAWSRLYAVEDHLRERLASPVRREAAAEAAAHALDELAKTTARRLELYEELKAEPLIGGTIERMLTFHRRDQGWPPRLAAARMAAANALVRWYAEQHGTGEGAARAWHALAERWPRTRLGDIAEGMAHLCRAEARPENLLTNPDIELGAAGKPPRGGPDWDPSKAPPGWSTWAQDPKAARFVWQEGGAASGERCVKLSGCQDPACYIQVIQVKPGERYFVRAMARTTAERAEDTGVRIRWQDATGKWVVPERDVPIQLGAGHRGDWQTLAGAVTVPQEAGRLVVLPGTKGQAEDEAAWFDDVFVCRVPD